MPTRLEQQGVAEWMMNEGAGAGREVQAVSKVPGISPGITVEACNDAVLSGKRQGTTRPSQERTYYQNGIERTYYHNGIATPQETAMEQCKLKRLRVAARMTKLGTNYKSFSETLPHERRLDPDESRKMMSGPTDTSIPGPPQELNEHSCYLCKRRMRNPKHLESHIRGRKHREVFESRQMNEQRRGYN